MPHLQNQFSFASSKFRAKDAGSCKQMELNMWLPTPSPCAAVAKPYAAVTWDKPLI